MRKNQLLARAVALMVVGSLALTGCGQSAKKNAAQTSSPTPASSGSKFNPKGTFPVIKDKVKLSIGMQSNSLTTDYANNKFTQFLSEKVNVDLSFVMLPEKDAAQKLALMVSSNEKLPDIISCGITDLDLYRYGSQGVFVPLNNYIETKSNYIKDILKNDPVGKSSLPLFTSPDGNIYTIPKMQQEYWNEWPFRYWINQTWLDKLGLKMPTTTDEFYNVLKAFKTKDPNGNGKADEIPLMGSNNGWGQSIVAYLMNAFIYCNMSDSVLQNNDFLLNNNGKIDVAYNKPEWRAGLEYMNKLCTEGLLSPLSFTQDVNQFKTVLENKDVQLNGAIAAGSMSVYLLNSPRKADMNLMAPLKGPNGANYATYVKSLPLSYFSITKDCKDPEAAFMLADYMWSEDASLFSFYGEKGVNWDFAPAGTKGRYSDIHPNSKIIAQKTGTGIWTWGQPGNVIWGDNNPTFRTNAIYDNIPDPNTATGIWPMKMMPLYGGKAPADAITKLMYTPDEAKELNDIKLALQTYVAESITGFITGSKKFSEWDSYVKELDKMDLKKFIQINQKAYDRMNKK